jgi:diadenosine tetraphosphate (Ap4A) HIT family hydrolase
MDTNTPNECPLCRTVARFATTNDPFVVHEFPHSVLIVGEHQFFAGYCVLVAKEHVRELHGLAPEVYQAFMGELYAATRAVAAAYRPWKMNHASYGNAVPHLHVHIIPRSPDEAEADRTVQPWAFADRFEQRRTTPETAARVAAQVRACL